MTLGRVRTRAAISSRRLLQFGFDGSDIWISRRDTLLAALHANPLAKFVTRVLQFGSEPLFDNVLPHDQLAEQVMLAKANLSSLGIPVTVSELAFGYQERGGAQDVLDAIDSINIHMLPFFSQQASTCKCCMLLAAGSWCADNGISGPGVATGAAGLAVLH